MDCYTLMILTGVTMVASTWSIPFYPVHRVPQIRVTRFAPLPHRHRFPGFGLDIDKQAAVDFVRAEPFVRPQQEKPKPERPKRDYESEEDQEEQNHDHKGNGGITGPVHTFVKTDKNANYKWGVRHHVGNKYTS